MPLTNPTEVVVLSQTVTLTDAQIKALPTTPVEIIPALGQGKRILWLGGDVVLDTSAGAYDPPDAGAFWQLCYLTSPFQQEASGLISVGAMADPGVFEAPVPPLGSYNAAEGYLAGGLTGADAIDNVGLGIADMYNGVPNYTGGNAANTLKVTVLYTIIDV